MMFAYTILLQKDLSGDNLFNPHWDPLEAQDCFLNILYPGCDEAHGPDHRQGSARQQLLQRAHPVRGGYPAGEAFLNRS